MKPLDFDIDPQVVGPFELLARLGAGGMGVAYLARRLPLGLTDDLTAAYRLAEPGGDEEAVEGRLVVVKMIQPGLLDGEPDTRERFDREIDAVRAVISARVPAVIAAAPPGAARPWFAMDYIAGPDLHTMVKLSGTFPVGAYAALGLALVDALRAIHGANLLHRDLKPGNVVLGPHGPVVLDFGLAVLAERQASQALTQTGAVMGTRTFMPLEQWKDTKRVKEPADVYALGATLFFAATGRAPYPFAPMESPPSFSGVDKDFVPLLAQILVATPSQRPTLKAVETGLLSLLTDADLTPQDAADQLAALVAGSGLIPELPAKAGTGHADPAIQERAQKAVDAGAAPDAPWGSDADDLSEIDPGFYGLVDTDEIELAAEAQGAAAEEAVAPPGYTPTLVDQAPTPAEPEAEVVSAHLPAPGAEPLPTSYSLDPPHPVRPPRPSAPPPVALRVAAELREAYAHRGDL
ncbi:serine/threonine-protein kinase [Streptomyces sp. 71268]|uniref:serine/threonine-protein kinase n=1 Tax=Streptomyces sp. 71268 TaxID=3002640 RepID=UPI0023F76BDA|nr:serine/threonine-protein kinase [Streptomyces sp. 71268]WEV24874.1 serine/threonine-protein kinase [Streptomyces sp. 71268]